MTARAPRSSTALPRGGSGTGTTSVPSGSWRAAARTARTSASGRMTRSAGPATSGSSSMRARSWSARCLSWPSCRRPSGRLVASASTGTLPNSARTSAGGRRSARNGPCSGARSAVTGPARRSAAPSASRRSVICITARGDPSGSCSTRWPASPGRALAGTVSVTGIGQGVPSASSPLDATADRSAVARYPVSGANAPEVSSSSSPSCASSGVQAGQSASSSGNRSAVTCASVFAGLGRHPGSDDAGEAVQRLADHVKQLIVALGEASSGQPGDGGAGDSHRR